MVSLKRLENENSVHYSSAMDVYLKSNKTSTKDVQRRNKKLYVLLNSFTGIFKLNNKDKSKDVASKEVYLPIESITIDTKNTSYLDNLGFNFSVLAKIIK